MKTPIHHTKVGKRGGGEFPISAENSVFNPKKLTQKLPIGRETKIYTLVTEVACRLTPSGGHYDVNELDGDHSEAGKVYVFR